MSAAIVASFRTSPPIRMIVESFSLSRRPVPSIAASPRSIQASWLGVAGGVVIGMRGIQGLAIRTARCAYAHADSRARQSPGGTSGGAGGVPTPASDIRM